MNIHVCGCVSDYFFLRLPWKLPARLSETSSFAQHSQSQQLTLNRNTQSLNFQFYLWTDPLQFNPHPTIPPPAANTRITDVTTGTA